MKEFFTKKRLAGAILMLFLFITPMGANAQWGEITKLYADDPEEIGSSNFGFSIDIRGDRAILGDHHNNWDGSVKGAAYIFELIDGEWEPTAKLVASDAATGDAFGVSVSIEGDRVIIGSHFDDDHGESSGSAYIFDYIDGVWVETVKLTTSDAAAGDRFGRSVSMSGDRAIIGAEFNQDHGDYSGSAYIFELVDGVWTEVVKLTALDASPEARFGCNVAISGEKAIIGAYGDDEAGGETGAAYIFEFIDGVWGQTAKLLASDMESSDRFGQNIAISGDKAVVGCYLNNVDGMTDAGSAYVFELVDGAWGETVILTASDAVVGDNFGSSIAIDGNTIIVGASKADGMTSESGVAYRFDLEEGSWSETIKIMDLDDETSYGFGASVAIDGETVFIKANDGTIFTGSEGVVYVYDLCSVPVPVTAMASEIEICDGDLVTLTGGGALTYTWDMDVVDGEPFSPETGTTTYTVTGTDDVGCQNTVTIDITVYDLPEVIASASDLTICIGQSVTLSGEGAMTYVWDMDVVDDVAFEPELGTATYTVAGTDVHGCENTASIEITVNDLPTITANASATEICVEQSVILTGEGAVSYTWDKCFDGLAFTPEVGTETYTVTGTDDNGCQNTATIDVTVNELPTITYTTTDETSGSDGGIDIMVTGGVAPFVYDWYIDETDDFDDDEDQTDLTAGTYVVVVKDELGCSSSEIIWVDSQLGIYNDNLDLISIYPNPTQADIQINLAGSFAYEIIAIDGNVIENGQATNAARISLLNYPTGLYLVRVNAEGSTRVVKIIKE